MNRWAGFGIMAAVVILVVSAEGTALAHCDTKEGTHDARLKPGAAAEHKQ